MTLRLEWMFLYLQDLLRWLWNANVLRLLLMAFVVLFIFIFLFEVRIEQKVRFYGAALQLLGVFAIFIGVRDKRRAFDDLPTAREAIRQWWSRRPRYGPKGAVINVPSIDIAASSGRPRVFAWAGRDATVEQRIETLEKSYASLAAEIDEVFANLDTQKSDHKRELKLERDARIKGDFGLDSRLKMAVAEGIPLEVLGACFIALGIVASSISTEIAFVLGETRVPS